MLFCFWVTIFCFKHSLLIFYYMAQIYHCLHCIFGVLYKPNQSDNQSKIPFLNYIIKNNKLRQMSLFTSMERISNSLSRNSRFLVISLSSSIQFFHTNTFHSAGLIPFFWLKISTFMFIVDTSFHQSSICVFGKCYKNYFSMFLFILFILVFKDTKVF